MQASPRWPPEGLALRRWTIGAIACVVAVVAGVNIPQQPYLIFAALLALLYLGTLAVNAPLLAWSTIALYRAALIVPFMPGRPFFWELCVLLAWPSLVAFFLMNRERLATLKFDRLEKWAFVSLAGYSAVLILLVVQRGIGFRAFGGDQMGGRFYVQQLVLAVLPLLLIVSDLKEKRILQAVAVSWVMSLTYLISDFAFASGGALQNVLYFFEVPPDASNFEAGFEATGLRRYQSLSSVGSAILAAVLVWMPVRDIVGRRVFVALPIAFGAVVLALCSGHRTVFVQTVTTAFLLASFQRFWTPLRAMGAALLIGATICSLYLFADSLPLSLQRAVSFLPGIEVTQLAKDNATDTIRDRIEVIKLAVNDIPDYLVVGRGFGMERLDITPADEVFYGVWLQYINGCIYNGLLGSLIKTGVPGLVFSLGFIVCVSRMALDVVRLARAMHPQAETYFVRLSLLISAQWFSAVAFFYVLHGDSAVWMKMFAVPAAMIFLFRRRLSALQSEQPVTGAQV